MMQLCMWRLSYRHQAWQQQKKKLQLQRFETLFNFENIHIFYTVEIFKIFTVTRTEAVIGIAKFALVHFKALSK